MATTAGTSAQREFERRRDARIERVRGRHPRLAGLLLALVEDPQHTTSWARGAEGERAVAKILDAIPGVATLHDRRFRTPEGRLTQGNIDHIAVVGRTIWVVDAKKYRGRLEVRRSGGILSPLAERLLVGGRDCTSLVDGVVKQVEAVRAQLDGFPGTTVRGALCFVDTELPLLDEDLAEVAIRGPRGLRAQVRPRRGAVVEHDPRILTHLADRFPPA